MQRSAAFKIRFQLWCQLDSIARPTFWLGTGFGGPWSPMMWFLSVSTVKHHFELHWVCSCHFMSFHVIYKMSFNVNVRQPRYPLLPLLPFHGGDGWPARRECLCLRLNVCVVERQLGRVDASSRFKSWVWSRCSFDIWYMWYALEIIEVHPPFELDARWWNMVKTIAAFCKAQNCLNHLNPGLCTRPRFNPVLLQEDSHAIDIESFAFHLSESRTGTPRACTSGHSVACWTLGWPSWRLAFVRVSIG